MRNSLRVNNWFWAAALAWFALGGGAVAAAAEAGDGGMFPFVISYDTPANVTNVAGWLQRPAGKQGFLRAEGEQLVNDAGPVRLWATNCCFEANFPTHEEAERLAARLARLGINCVRLHHMDSHSIWGRSPNKLTIDPEKLERLDYLIAQYKNNGVYVDINLHVSRQFGKAEGFTGEKDRPRMDKGLDNFEPRMIQLQKKYARELLTHVNRYTGKAYVDEPAVAVVEINNENALFAEWGGGGLDDLPEPYSTTFRQQWNQWLRAKYHGTAGLRKAWNVGQSPLGQELLVNGTFARPLGKTWSLEADQHSVEATPQAEGPAGRPALQIKVLRPNSIAWRPQLIQAGLAVKKGLPYTLSFQARADAPRSIEANCMQAHAPWERVGLTARSKLETKWKAYRYTFIADRDDANARVTFGQLGQGSLWLAEVSLRPGGIIGLEAGQKLEDDSVPVMLHGGPTGTRQARHDWIDFLWDTEQTYWSGMYRYVKDELHTRSLVTGTQLSYSPAHIQAGMDYIDAHSYWQHPHFPGRPWDMNNWTIGNVALVNAPKGTIAGLAVRRVAGVVFTVSEYNHPQPNQFAAEGFPLVAAYGAFQGWNGIFSFAYCHNQSFEPDHIESFFDIKSDTAKLVHMPACVALFLRGDAAVGQKPMPVPVSKDAERQQLYDSQSAWTVTADHFGLDPRWSLVHRVAMDLGGRTAPLSPGGRGVGGEGAKPSKDATLPAIPEDQASFVSDNGQLRWDVSQPKAGYFTADTPRTKLFSGFVAGRTFTLGDVRLAIGPTQMDWATVSLVAVDGGGFDKPGHLLLAATAAQRNTDAALQSLPGDKITCGRNWGRGPTLCEGVPAQITLPVAAGRAACYPLDESGNRRGSVPLKADGDKTLLAIGPQYETVWYEIEVK